MFRWQQLGGDRGLSWICRHGDEVVGDISFCYLPSNDGGSFARNHRKGSVSIVVRHDTTVLAKRSLSAWSRNEADKLVRQTIREEKLRDMVEAAHAAAIQSRPMRRKP